MKPNFKFQLQPVIQPDMLETLSSVFPNLSMKTSDQLGCHNITFKMVSLEELNSASSLKELSEKVNAKHFELSKYAHDIKMFKEYEQLVREEFMFTSDVQDKVKLFLQSVKDNYFEKNNLNQSLVESCNFIGVHVRRTDYKSKCKNSCKFTTQLFPYSVCFVLVLYNAFLVFFRMVEKQVRWEIGIKKLFRQGYGPL